MSPSRNLRIRDVYDDNLEQEFELIKDVVDEFPHIAMDTEFPGVVVRPLGSFNSNSTFRYQTLRLNVDILKLIQLGLTFTDDHGNLPTCGTDEFCVWQFNFKEFRMEKDFFAHDSIQLLKQSGIDFKKNESQGCDAQRFAELLMSSGVVLNENVHWITFQSSYDFAYLLKLLTGQRLPDEEDMFLDRLKLYFPSIYDIKYLIKFCNNLHGGLNRIAETLDVARIGPSHQAGSDSLLTSGIFWKLRKKYFNDHIEEYAGVVSGLGIDGDSVIGMNQL